MTLYDAASEGQRSEEPRSHGWSPFRILFWSGRAYRAVFHFMLGLPLGVVYTEVAGSLFGSPLPRNWPFNLLVLLGLALAVGWGLGWMLPGLDGLSVCRRILRSS